MREIVYILARALFCHHFLSLPRGFLLIRHVSILFRIFVTILLKITKMVEKISLEQDTVEYYKFLMQIKRAEFEKELLKIVSSYFEILSIVFTL